MIDEPLNVFDEALPIPDEMTGVTAAGFFIPYQTAWVALVRRARITSEDTVLVLGSLYRVCRTGRGKFLPQ